MRHTCSPTVCKCTLSSCLFRSWLRLKSRRQPGKRQGTVRVVPRGVRVVTNGLLTCSVTTGGADMDVKSGVSAGSLMKSKFPWSNETTGSGVGKSIWASSTERWTAQAVLMIHEHWGVRPLFTWRTGIVKLHPNTPWKGTSGPQRPNSKPFSHQSCGADEGLWLPIKVVLSKQTLLKGWKELKPDGSGSKVLESLPYLWWKIWWYDDSFKRLPKIPGTLSSKYQS